MKTFSKIPGNEQKREVPCPVCVNPAYVPRWDCGTYGFVRCVACGALYPNPQPVQDELTLRYDQEYFQYEIRNQHVYFDLMMKTFDDIDFDAIEKTLPGERAFLDVGCATGMLLEAMKHRGWQEHGVEVCVPAAEYGREVRGCDIFVGTLEQAGFEPSLFDVVHCSHLIEHLTDPSSFVNEVRRALNPNGHFLVTTPNVSGMQARIFGSRWRSAIADHMVLFSKSTLRRLLEDHGFEVLKIVTWGGLGKGTAPRRLKMAADALAKPLGFGDVMAILARAIPRPQPRT